MIRLCKCGCRNRISHRNRKFLRGHNTGYYWKKHPRKCREHFRKHLEKLRRAHPRKYHKIMSEKSYVGNSNKTASVRKKAAQKAAIARWAKNGSHKRASRIMQKIANSSFGKKSRSMNMRSLWKTGKITKVMVLPNLARIRYQRISKYQLFWWHKLRRYGFVLEYQVGEKFIDIAKPSCKLGVEIDGGHWHHNHQKDAARTKYLMTMGWKIIRIHRDRNCSEAYISRKLKEILLEVL